MMTEAEFTATLAKINELETEHANTLQAVREAIAGARKLNEATRAGQGKLNVLAEAVTPLKAAAAEYVAAVNAERKRVAAEENARKEAEAKAAKAKEQSEVERQAKEIEELKAQLAAKG